MRKHAFLSASSMAVVSVCPLALHFNRIIPSVTSPAAERGTKLHEQVENFIAGKPIEQIEGYQEAELVAKWITPYLKHPVAFTETKVYFNDLFGVAPNKAYGFADLFTYEDKTETLNVIDYKFGKIPVEVKDNVQLMLYAYGAVKFIQLPVKTVNLVIAQPSNETLKTYSYTIKELYTKLHSLFDDKKEEIRQYIDFGLEDCLSQCKGEHCFSKWCKGRDICNKSSNLITA